MKKNFLILSACLMIGTFSNSTTLPVYGTESFSDYEKTEIDYLIEHGQYFDIALTSKNNLNYTLEDNALLVSIKDEKDLSIRFGFNGNFSYDYPFEDVQINYKKDSEEKSAILTSHFNKPEDDSKQMLMSTLTINDGQSFDIYFNYNSFDSTINNLRDMTPINLVENLYNQIFNIYKKQWNEVMLFNSNMLNFNNQYTNILLGPLYYSYLPARKNSLTTLYREDWEFDNTKKVEFIAPSLTFFYSTYNYIPSNDAWDKDQLMKTLSILFYIDEPFDDSSTINLEDLAFAVFSLDGHYLCESHRCYSKDNYLDVFHASQGISEDGFSILLKESDFIDSLKELFNIEMTSTIDETRRLESGIVQSKEENYYVGFTPLGDMGFEYCNGVVINSFTTFGNQIEFDVSLFDGTHNFGVTDNQFFSLNTLTGTVIPEDEYNQLNMDDYVKQHIDLFPRWKVLIDISQGNCFYRIISAQKV